jgi:hypothetical protein
MRRGFLYEEPIEFELAIQGFLRRLGVLEDKCHLFFVLGIGFGEEDNAIGPIVISFHDFSLIARSYLEAPLAAQDSLQWPR